MESEEQISTFESLVKYYIDSHIVWRRFHCVSNIREWLSTIKNWYVTVRG